MEEQKLRKTWKHSQVIESSSWVLCNASIYESGVVLFSVVSALVQFTEWHMIIRSETLHSNDLFHIFFFRFRTLYSKLNCSELCSQDDAQSDVNLSK